MSQNQAQAQETAKHMVDALSYLIRVASEAGMIPVVSRLRAARWALILHKEGAVGGETGGAGTR